MLISIETFKQEKERERKLQEILSCFSRSDEVLEVEFIVGRKLTVDELEEMYFRRKEAKVRV